MEEGNRPYPRCPQCDIFVSHKALKGRHLTTDFCRQGAKKKRCRLAEEEAQAGMEAAFTDYRTPIAPVTSFRYL